MVYHLSISISNPKSFFFFWYLTQILFIYERQNKTPSFLSSCWCCLRGCFTTSLEWEPTDGTNIITITPTPTNFHWWKTLKKVKAGLGEQMHVAVVDLVVSNCRSRFVFRPYPQNGQWPDSGDRKDRFYFPGTFWEVPKSPPASPNPKGQPNFGERMEKMNPQSIRVRDKYIH